MKLLSDSELRRLLPAEAAIESSARAFSALARREIIVPVRSEIQRPDGLGVVFAMPGFLPGRVFGVKVIATRSAASAAMVLLFDTESLKPLGLLSGDHLTDWRTGGGIAAATRLLARPEASVHVIFGAGRLAGPCARLVAAVRPLARTILVSRTAQRAEALAAALTSEGIATIVAADPQVVAEADIVTTVTTSEMPVFPGAALRPGAHVNLGGAFRPDAREADDDLARRGLYWLDSEAACLARAGDLVMPLASGALDRSRVIGEIGAALDGRLRGRLTAEDISVFKSLGNAAQDICLAEEALRLAGPGVPSFDPTA
jgi:ornithine cyclodeaminase